MQNTLISYMFLYINKWYNINKNKTIEYKKHLYNMKIKKKNNHIQI